MDATCTFHSTSVSSAARVGLEESTMHAARSWFPKENRWALAFKPLPSVVCAAVSGSRPSGNAARGSSNTVSAPGSVTSSSSVANNRTSGPPPEPVGHRRCHHLATRGPGEGVCDVEVVVGHIAQQPDQPPPGRAAHTVEPSYAGVAVVEGNQMPVPMVDGPSGGPAAVDPESPAVGVVALPEDDPDLRGQGQQRVLLGVGRIPLGGHRPLGHQQGVALADREAVQDRERRVVGSQPRRRRPRPDR